MNGENRFFTAYNRNFGSVFPSNNGERVRRNYKPLYSDTGVYDLAEDGYINSYDDIQSHADSCDLRLIIERYNMTGDDTLFNKREGFYEDVTEFPLNYAELQNQIIDAERRFLDLPIKVRELFGNSAGEFYSQYGSKEFYEKLGVKTRNDVVDEIKDDIVVDDSESKGDV